MRINTFAGQEKIIPPFKPHFERFFLFKQPRTERYVLIYNERSTKKMEIYGLEV